MHGQPKSKYRCSDCGDCILYNRARELVLRNRTPSQSYLQRALRIGYNQAAAIMERLESEGLVTPPDETGRRRLRHQESPRVLYVLTKDENLVQSGDNIPLYKIGIAESINNRWYLDSNGCQCVERFPGDFRLVAAVRIDNSFVASYAARICFHKASKRLHITCAGARRLEWFAITDDQLADIKAVMTAVGNSVTGADLYRLADDLGVQLPLIS